MAYALAGLPEFYTSILSAVEFRGSFSSSRRGEVRSVIKFLNTQNITPIEIHRQCCQQSFPEDFSFLVAKNSHGAPVVQKIVRQVGAKATDTRTQIKAHGVSIDSSPSFLAPQEIPARSAFSE